MDKKRKHKRYATVLFVDQMQEVKPIAEGRGISAAQVIREFIDDGIKKSKGE